MSYKTLAAINVGSGEVSMKIYEISRKTGIREIDYVRYYIELGSDTYTKGYIEYDLVRELCDVLERFSMKMESLEKAWESRSSDHSFTLIILNTKII